MIIEVVTWKRSDADDGEREIILSLE